MPTTFFDLVASHPFQYITPKDSAWHVRTLPCLSMVFLTIAFDFRARRRSFSVIFLCSCQAQGLSMGTYVGPTCGPWYMVGHTCKWKQYAVELISNYQLPPIWLTKFPTLFRKPRRASCCDAHTTPYDSVGQRNNVIGFS